MHGIQCRADPVCPRSSEKSIAEDQKLCAFRKCRTSYVTIGSRLQAGGVVLSQLRVDESFQATVAEPMHREAGGKRGN